MSNVVKFTDVVEDMACSLHYSARNSSKTASNMVGNISVQESSPFTEANRILNAAKYEALKLITEAREQALLVKKVAQQEAIRMLEASKNEGYEQGLSEGRQEAEAETLRLLEETGLLLSKLHQKRNDIIKQNEDIIKELSIGIARKVIDTELNENDSLFLNIFRKAVQECTSGEWIKVTVSSYDYEFVTSNSELLLSMVKGAKYIDVVKLNHCQKGTCIVESSSGIVNASVETQLERISDAFHKADQSSYTDEYYEEVSTFN